MSRLIFLLALALAPLVAAAHGGHHAPPAVVPAALEANGAIAAIAAAPSHCPGGGHEDCCCHDGWCTSGSVTPALADAPSRPVPHIAAEAKVAVMADPALPSAALSRFSTRGPPAIS